MPRQAAKQSGKILHVALWYIAPSLLGALLGATVYNAQGYGILFRATLLWVIGVFAVGALRTRSVTAARVAALLFSWIILVDGFASITSGIYTGPVVSLVYAAILDKGSEHHVSGRGGARGVQGREKGE